MRKFIMILLVVIMLIPAIPSLAAGNEDKHEVTIYPNGKGMFRTTSNDLVIGDVRVTYSVDDEKNEIDIYFDEAIFVGDVISEGDTVHKTIKFDSEDELIEVEEELSTSGFVSANVSNIKLNYEDVNSVNSVTIQSVDMDFHGGLLDGKPFYYMSAGSSDFSNRSSPLYNSTDADIGTSDKVGSSSYQSYFRFEEPTDINKIKILSSNGPSVLFKEFGTSSTNFLRNDGTLQSSKTTLNGTTTGLEIHTNLKNIEVIILKSTNHISLEVFEFNVYGEVQPEEPKPPQEEITELDYTVESNNNVTLSWTNPSNDKFEGVKIYRDGIYLETTTEECFSETLPIGTYQYRMTTLEAGEESKGVILDVSVQTIPTPVKGINMINTSSSGGSITWDPNPKGQNISKYIIYINGQKHGEVENPPYQLEGIEVGKKYDIAVSAVNDLGEGDRSKPVSYIPSKIEDLKTAIKIEEIFSYIAMLFTKVWPLLALTITVALFPYITNAIKSVVRSRRSA